MFTFRDLKVKWKIIFPYTLMIFLIVGFILSWYFVSEAKRMEVQQLKKMEIVIQEVTEASSHPLAIRQYDRLNKLLVHLVDIDPDIRYVHLFNTAGLCIVCTDKSSGEEVMPDRNVTTKSLPSGVSQAELAGDEADYELRYPVMLFNVVMGELHMGISRKGIHAAVRRFININLMIGFTTVIVGIIIFNLIIHFGVSNPIRELNRVSREISSGNLDERMLYSSRDELGELANAFNSMTSRLGDTMNGLNEEIAERKRAEEELRKHRDHLEEMVEERTAELKLMNEQLQQEVAERKQAEEQLELAKEKAEESDKLKSAFLATMSHELRTPLNSIIGFTSIILQGLSGPLNDEQKDQLGMVKNSAYHLLNLINDVLDISRIESGRLKLSLQPFDMHESINKVLQTVAPLAEKKGLALLSEEAPEVEQVVSDRQRVEQIMINLANNAIKFTEKGEVRIECEVSNGYLVTYVKDTGIGIKPENIDNLFKSFQQIDTGLDRKHEGTGLGLSICQKLVELLGGEIRVESKWGEGSTFTFKLPIEKI